MLPKRKVTKFKGMFGWRVYEGNGGEGLYFIFKLRTL